MRFIHTLLLCLACTGCASSQVSSSKPREQQIIAQISVVGNTLLSDQELLALVPILPGLGKDTDAIERGRRAIVALYKKQGNYLVEVFAETILYPKGGVDERTGLQIDESVALIYRVIEGLRVRVKAVSVIGNHSFTDKELTAELDTNTSGEFFHRGELNESVLETDRQRILSFYMYRGYRDARVSFTIMLDQNDKEAKVTFLIEEGPQYILGGISLKFIKAGNTQPVFTAEQIAALIPMKAGDVYRPIDVAEAVKKIHRAYGVLGRRKVKVDARAVIMTPAKIDVIFVIEEGIPMKVGLVTVTGNTVIKDNVIRGKLGLRPGYPFNEFELEHSIDRLKRSGLISNVTERYYEDPHNPGYTNVEVTIKDQQTGTMKVGEVIIKGNNVTEDHVIRSYIQLFPGQDIDSEDLEQCKTRLLETQRFRRVNVTIMPENSANPGYRDLLIEVSDGPTHSMNLGFMAGAESGITLHFSIQGESSPNRTTDEILDAINTRSVVRPANSPPLQLEQAWLTVCQIRTELLGEEINRDELRKQIDAMIGWIMSADDPANLERRFAAGIPLKTGFDIERLALLGVAIAFAEAVDDVALAKKSLDFSFVIMNNSVSTQKHNPLPFLIAGCLKPVRQTKDSTVCVEIFTGLQSWLVHHSDHFQPEHLPWLDFAHAYVLSSRGLTNEALAVLPSLKSNVPDEPLFLLLQQTSLWKNHRSNPYTSQLSQRWVFDTIHALSIYLLATEVEEKEQSIELLGLQFDEFPKELSDDLLSRLMKYKLPPITSFGKLDSDEKMQLIVYSVLLQEIKARVIEDNISDARSFLDLLLNEDFQSNTKTLLKSASLEETQ